jgi:glycosyltransferase involved in cell wall biosynthesis
MSKPRFTLFTPCYNSEKFIHRVFDSINNFTFRDFEWIVVNDASTDNTHSIISEYISKVKFKVKYLNRPVNKMLDANYRYALSVAEGELFLPMGHDDEWTEDTLTIFDQVFKDTLEIVCVGALCKTQYGNLVDFEYPQEYQVSDFFKIAFEKNRFRKEIPFCYYLNIFREFYKGEFENINMEIGCVYPMAFINKVLRTYYINENATALSNRTRIQLAANSHNHYKNWVNKYQYYMKHSPIFRYRGIFAYAFQGILANISFNSSIEKIRKPHNKLLITFFYLPALIISKRFK